MITLFFSDRREDDKIYERAYVLTPTPAKPFLKWAGGKKQLLPVLRAHYPEKIGTYIEPFVGAGAVLFDIAHASNIERIVINDINTALINSYISLRDDLDSVTKIIDKLTENYPSLSLEEQGELYYNVRERYNSEALSEVEKTAFFIFLNKTCFNGLYRVNRKGGFNVPFGKQRNPTFYNRSNLEAVAALLQGAVILNGDYAAVEEYVGQDTFIYLDPPYRPLSTSASFNAYDASGFNDDSQAELAQFCKRLEAQGTQFVLSNADPKNADPGDTFFDDLYEDFTVERVHASRAISAKASTRGKITELLIHN